MKTCIDTLRESNKQFFTPDDVSPVVGLTAQKIREKAYQGDDLGFVYNCVDCGTGQRKPRVKIPREEFFKYYDETHKMAEKKISTKDDKGESSRHSGNIAFLNTTFYTVVEVADKLKVSRDTVYEWIASGELESHKFGKQYRITDRALQDFIIAHSTAAWNETVADS